MFEEPLPIGIVHQPISKYTERFMNPKANHLRPPEPFFRLDHQYTLNMREKREDQRVGDVNSFSSNNMQLLLYRGQRVVVI